MRLNTLHYRIYETVLERGQIADEQLERLKKFRRYAKSTIRTRRHELAEHRLLTPSGTRLGRRRREVTLWSAR